MADTLFRWDIINALLGTTAQKRFLEIGVQRGICGAKIKATHKVGVDPEHMPPAGRHYTKLCRCTSDEFFEDLPADTRFDVVLVHGLHHADQVLRDVDNVLRHLSDDGVIVLHDCNPQSEDAQRVPRMVGVWNGDCWRAMVALRQRPDLDAFTVDIDHGVGIVRRKANPNPLRPVGDITYEGLTRDRAGLLNLVSPRAWEERFGAPLALGKITLVTAIFGGRDAPVLLPPSLDVDDRVMFTDGAGRHGWRVVKTPGGSEPRRIARQIKTLALDRVDGDIVLWVDGRIKLSGVPLRPLLRAALRGSDVAGYPHPWRRCVYAEARECAKLRLAPGERIDAQVAEYHAAGMPAGAGLWNTMVLARRRSAASLELGRAWWAEIEKHTLRDQISFPFVLWQAGLTCASMGPDVYAPRSNKYFKRGRHVK